MNNSQELVRIRLLIGRPKRKSGAYVRKLFWGQHSSTRRQEEGDVVNLGVFHRYQLEEGPDIFDGLDYRLIPCKKG